jgi:hypothetical protein
MHLVGFIVRTRIAILKTIDPKLSIHHGVHAYHEHCVRAVAKTRECSVAVSLSVLYFDVKIAITGGIGLELFVVNLESAGTEIPRGNVPTGPASLYLVEEMCHYK